VKPAFFILQHGDNNMSHIESVEQLDNVGEVVRYYATTKPDHLAMVFDDRKTTYAELHTHSSRVANGLRAEAIGESGRIAYLGKNTDRYYELFFGTAKSGVVMVAVNWRLAYPEVEYILNDANVQILFVESEFECIAQTVLNNCEHLKKIVFIDGDDERGYISWRERHIDQDIQQNIGRDSICLQMYTSGTTGNPKGVLLPHRCFFSQRKAERTAGSWAQWDEGDVNLVAMPTFHIGGTGWGFVAFYHGATNVIHSVPDADKIAEDIAAYKITKMFVVPAVLQQIVPVAQSQGMDLTSMKYVIYGASPIPESLLIDAIALFECGFCQQYGMTEATGAVSYLPPEDHDVKGNARMKSCGKAFPGIEFKICDEQGNSLPQGETGEIYIQSPAIMSGYWNLDTATNDALQEGWYKSGDAGYLDKDGYLYMQDRVKDMIVSGGENIYPAEIESVLYKHPAVKDVAVIGVPDQKWGEAVKAIVITDRPLDMDDIIQYARQYIAGYKVPRSVDFVDEIPRNASGKILKNVLREKFWKGYERRVN
jgi:acyl-CoA synthetase (AMP-forming)/AMP-acid ligase II